MMSISILLCSKLQIIGHAFYVTSNGNRPGSQDLMPYEMAENGDAPSEWLECLVVEA